MDSQQPQGDVLAQARRVVSAHGVVALPTETFYGLSVSAFDGVACERVFEIKGRPASKALPCIVSDASQLDAIAEELTPLARSLAATFWPGPLTLIVPSRPSVAAASENGTIAVRVSSLPLARALAALCGPLTSTSANPTGSPAATTADEVEASLGDAVDLILDGGASPGGAPSTIVDACTQTPRLVRAGVIDFDEILERASNP